MLANTLECMFIPVSMYNTYVHNKQGLANIMDLKKGVARVTFTRA